MASLWSAVHCLMYSKFLSVSIRKLVVPSFDISKRLIYPPICSYVSEMSSLYLLVDSSNISSSLSLAIASCLLNYFSVKAIFPSVIFLRRYSTLHSSKLFCFHDKIIDPKPSWQGRHHSVWEYFHWP